MLVAVDFDGTISKDEAYPRYNFHLFPISILSKKKSR